jgi:hypothetical protein
MARATAVRQAGAGHARGPAHYTPWPGRRVNARRGPPAA